MNFDNDKNLQLYETFRIVPDEAKKKIIGGRVNGMTDINPVWRIKKLTEAFGPCGVGWYYKPVNKWIETVGNEVAAFVDIELFVKFDNEWSMPIHGSGGSRLATVEKSGVYVSDECYKMATTDALSVACKQLGIGADVYFEKDCTKYNAREVVVTADDINALYTEIVRTGVEVQKVCSRYKKDSVMKMAKAEIDSAIRTLKKMQESSIPCPHEPKELDVPDDSGLPFK